MKAPLRVPTSSLTVVLTGITSFAGSGQSLFSRPFAGSVYRSAVVSSSAGWRRVGVTSDRRRLRGFELEQLQQVAFRVFERRHPGAALIVRLLDELRSAALQLLEVALDVV